MQFFNMFSLTDGVAILFSVFDEITLESSGESPTALDGGTPRRHREV